jgi:hypothetical protein
MLMVHSTILSEPWVRALSSSPLQNPRNEEHDTYNNGHFRGRDVRHHAAPPSHEVVKQRLSLQTGVPD